MASTHNRHWVRQRNIHNNNEIRLYFLQNELVTFIHIIYIYILYKLKQNIHCLITSPNNYTQTTNLLWLMKSYDKWFWLAVKMLANQSRSFISIDHRWNSHLSKLNDLWHTIWHHIYNTWQLINKNRKKKQIQKKCNIHRWYERSKIS